MLKQGEYGIISTVDDQNQPYGVPVSFALMDHYIVFHSANEGYKLDNFNHNPQVSFCVVGKTEVLPAEFSTRYESAIIFGQVEELMDAEKVQGLKALAQKYSPAFEAQGDAYIEAALTSTTVFAISIDRITGKARH